MKIIKGLDGTIEERNELIKNEALRIQQSTSVLIIGGGSVGVELAGEIAYEYPKKNITLVEGGNRILGSLSASTSRKALSVLKELHVDVVTHTRLKKEKTKEYGLMIMQKNIAQI